MDPFTMMMLSQLLGGLGGGGGGGGGIGGEMGLPGLGIAAGGSLLGAALDKRQARKEKHSMAKRLRKAIGATESIMGKGYAQQEALTREATKKQVGGYEAAKREAARLGRGSKRTALEREQQLGAGLSQGLASRGLGSTTVGANLQRGIAGDTTRQLADINEGLAGLFGDLSLGQAGAEAGGLQQLAGLAGQRGQTMAGLTQMGLLGGQQLGQFQAPLSSGPGTLQMALPGIMSALGQYQGEQQQGGMNPELMRLLQQLFSQGGAG